MRVGLVSAEFPPAIGGVGDHTERLARELFSAGLEVDVLTSLRLSAQPLRDVTVLREVRRWDGRIWWQVPLTARRRGWDVLHIQYQPAAYALHGAINFLPWLVRGGSPAVVTSFHDLRFPYLFPKAGPLRTAAVAALARGSDAAIAVSDDDLPQLERWRAGKATGTTRHVPLGDQLGAVPPADFAPTAWRSRLGVAIEAPLVAHFGLINASKGVIELVEAIARLDGAHLALVGERLGSADATNAGYLQQVERRIDDLAISDRVHWTGRVSPAELAGWLDTADVVALPFLDGATLRRTSLITAWRRGRPVVTTHPPANARWLSDAPGTAAFVPAGNGAALARAIEELLAKPARAAALGAAGSAFAERFSWPAVVRQTIETFEAALSARRA